MHSDSKSLKTWPLTQSSATEISAVLECNA